MRTTTLATFYSAAPAARLRNWLSRAGVPSKVRHEEWQKAPRAFHLEIPHDHTQHANALLSEWDTSSNALREAVRCPCCSALRLRYPHVAVKFLPDLFKRLLLSLGILPHRFECRECRHVWRAPEPMELQQIRASG